MDARKLQTRNRALPLVIVLVILAALLVAAYTLSRENDNSGEKTTITLFLSYVPSVQFAPVYVAAERGYFADERIDIRFENGNEADGLERIAANDLKFGLVSGEQVVLARANDRPVVYVFEWYHNFPVGIVSPAHLNITQPSDLVGRIVGACQDPMARAILGSARCSTPVA